MDKLDNIMKIVALSDLHLDYIKMRNGLSEESIVDLLEKMKNKILSFNPDVFIFAGDISRKVKDIEIFLNVFKNLSFYKIFVPGNHDIWIENGEDSFEKYRNILRKVSENYNFYYLPAFPLIIKNIGFVGSLGWYDYSLGGEEFSFYEYEKGKYKNLKWREVYWKLVSFKDEKGNRLSNPEVCKIMQEDLRNQIEEIKDKVNIIVAIIHTLPFEDLIYTRNFFSAYLGSKFLGDILLENEKIKYLICGHEHNPLILNKNRIRIYRCPFGYLRNIKDWEENILKGIKTFEIII
ncbi:MAG: metallophosphoesterase [Dictyoglomaceae bacterium]